MRKFFLALLMTAGFALASSTWAGPASDMILDDADQSTVEGDWVVGEEMC